MFRQSGMARISYAFVNFFQENCQARKCIELKLERDGYGEGRINFSFFLSKNGWKCYWKEEKGMKFINAPLQKCQCQQHRQGQWWNIYFWNEFNYENEAAAPYSISHYFSSPHTSFLCVKILESRSLKSLDSHCRRKWKEPCMENAVKLLLCCLASGNWQCKINLTHEMPPSLWMTAFMW